LILKLKDVLLMYCR